MRPNLWIDRPLPTFDRPPPAEADIVIVGAGIAGLTCAIELARRGAHVHVLDRGPIGSGETGRTSAHLASALDEHFTTLEQTFGSGGAKLAYESHATAIDYIEAMVRIRGIDCEFRRVDGYLIEPPGHPRDEHRFLEKEQAAAQRAGLDCELVDEAPLPFDTGPALRFRAQAEFHPIKYLRGLADAAVELGANIHTGVNVVGIEPGEPVRLQLEGDRTLLARVVVDCSNGAMSSMLKMPLRQAAYRSYCVAFALPHGSLPHVLVDDTADPYHFVRVASDAHGQDVLIVGGEDHRVGQEPTDRQWVNLERWTRQWIPVAGDVVGRWSGQIIEPTDGLAHIGRSPDLEHVYLCTGDSGHGLTHGTIAGLIIPEMIHGMHPRWERIYDPRRSHLRAAGTLIAEAAKSSAPYVDWLRPGDVSSVDEIEPGSGAIVRRGLHLIAAYRDGAGRCHELNATCPHMRGVVQWNAAEQSWDCPCHGSRFDRYGAVLNGPAVSDLSPISSPGHDRAPEPAVARADDEDADTRISLPYPAMAPPAEREG